MKNLLKPTNLPILTAGMGGLALVLRKLLYALAVDEKGLLPVNHPLEVVLGILSFGALLYIAISCWRLGGSNRYRDNFRADPKAALGHAAAAAGIVLTLMTRPPMMANYLGDLWKVLGYIAPVCLLLAGFAQLQGRRPFFVLHLIPCLFLVFHIINHYQYWSGNPQFQDYVFTLFGSMALMFFAFYHVTFDVGSGNRRMHLGMGLAAVYLCMAELAQTLYPWLYMGGIIWVLTSLCTLKPVPKAKPKTESEQEK